MTPVKKIKERIIGVFGGATGLWLFAGAFLAYVIAVWWGVPHATAADRAFVWGSDELAPLGAAGELYRVFLGSGNDFNPQYPLLHYAVQAILVVPYLAFVYLTGGIDGVSATYPFGFTDPVSTLVVTTVLSRLTSTLMGAGVVVAAWRAALNLGSRRYALFAALAAMLAFPMFYYSRTSNVDMPSLFWTACGLTVVTAVIKDGYTTRRAVWFGLFAALATATKDASFFAFLFMTPALIPWRRLRAFNGAEAWQEFLKPTLTGATASALVYAVASGFVFHPGRFFAHVDYILASTAAYLYPEGLGGTVGLVRETFGHLGAGLGFPAVVAALVGIWYAVRRDRRILWLLLPGLAVFFFTVLPVRFVNFRYMIIPTYVLTFVVAAGVDVTYQAALRKGAVVAMAVPVLVFGWSGLRAADVTYQMLGDSRYWLAEWVEQHTDSGDRIAFFGAPQKLPHLPADVVTLGAEAWCSDEQWMQEQPEIVMVIPQQHFEIDREWRLAEHVYQGLVDGRLGYRQVIDWRRPGLSAQRPVPFVNPRVQVFVRADRTGVEERFQQAALLEPIEQALGLTPTFPPGLERNREPAKARDLCDPNGT